jgi:hypothetical protein
MVSGDFHSLKGKLKKASDPGSGIQMNNLKTQQVTTPS